MLFGIMSLVMATSLSAFAARGPVPGGHHKSFATELRLTAPQKRELTSVWDSYTKKTTPYRKEMAARRSELLALAAVKHPDRAKMHRVGDRINRSHKSIIDAKVDALYRASTVLTPSQRRTAAEYIKQCKAQDMGMMARGHRTMGKNCPMGDRKSMGSSCPMGQQRTMAPSCHMGR